MIPQNQLTAKHVRPSTMKCRKAVLKIVDDKTVSSTHATWKQQKPHNKFLQTGFLEMVSKKK